MAPLSYIYTYIHIHRLDRYSPAYVDIYIYKYTQRERERHTDLHRETTGRHADIDTQTNAHREI